MPFYHAKGARLIICLLQIRLGKIFVYSLNIRSSLSVILFLNCLLAFCDCLYMSLSTYESVRLKIPKSTCEEWGNMSLKCFVLDKNVEK